MRAAVYDSPFLHYSGKEILDKDNQPLEKLDADEQAMVDRFNPGARWPFLIINGQYVLLTSGFSPSVIDGMDFETLRAQLQSGEDTDATRAILAEADLITKYVCHSTGGQPEEACSA
jgi:hypothetical protein